MRSIGAPAELPSVKGIRAFWAAREGVLPARPHKAGQAHRGDAHRHGVAAAEQFNINIDGEILNAEARHDLDRIEPGEYRVAFGCTCGGHSGEKSAPTEADALALAANDVRVHAATVTGSGIW